MNIPWVTKTYRELIGYAHPKIGLMIFLNIAGVIGTPFDSLFCWIDLASISFALSPESSPE
jgi:hypothetical protein